MSLFGDELDWGRVMFGENAAHVPVTMTVQRMKDGLVLIVGASKMLTNNPLLFGSQLGHVHFLGDAVFRPRWVGESDKLAGSGAAGLLTGSSFADPDQWRTILGKI